MDLEREEGEELEENMEQFDDSSSSPSGTLRNYPLTCKVIYSYKVTQHTHTQPHIFASLLVGIAPVHFLTQPSQLSSPFPPRLNLSYSLKITKLLQCMIWLHYKTLSAPMKLVK